MSMGMFIISLIIVIWSNLIIYKFKYIIISVIIMLIKTYVENALKNHLSLMIAYPRIMTNRNVPTIIVFWYSIKFWSIKLRVIMAWMNPTIPIMIESSQETRKYVV